VRELIVVYGEGSAGPTEIADVAAGLAHLTFFADRNDPHAARVWELLAALARVVDLASPKADAACERADGITTFSESMVRATARLAFRHGLPYHSVPTALLLTDKVLQRASLNAAGVTPVRYETVDTAGEVLSALTRIGFPAIVKPRYGQSSANTIRCDSDAATAVGLDGDGGWTVEELLPGQAHPQGTWLADYCSVETAVWAGQPWHFAISDKLPLAEPFRERGSIMPSALPDDWQDRVRQVATAAIHALGITIGVTHTEVKLTPDGPKIIEVNGRLGGSVAPLLARSAGFDAVRMQLMIALGEPPRPAPIRHTRHTFHYGVMPPERRVVVRQLASLTHFKGLPGVVRVERLAAAGHVLDWRRGSRERVFTIWGESADVSTLKELVATLDRLAPECVFYE
jgi:biotin carboxylase